MRLHPIFPLLSRYLRGAGVLKFHQLNKLEFLQKSFLNTDRLLAGVLDKCAIRDFCKRLNLDDFFKRQHYRRAQPVPRQMMNSKTLEIKAPKFHLTELLSKPRR